MSPYPKVFYSIVDGYGVDHLIFRGHRTLCGRPVLANDDTMMGYRLSHATAYLPFGAETDCAECLTHGARLP